MRPAVATVLSPRPWEGRLVQCAAETGLVRLTARCFDPQDIGDVAAVVIGSEAPWFGRHHIAALQERGIAVLGIYARGDRPAIARLCASNVDQLFVEDTDPLIILRAIRDVAGDRNPARYATPMIALRQSRAIQEPAD